MKADVMFQKDVTMMVRCDLFLDSHSRYSYLAEQPPVWLSKQHQEHSDSWIGQGLVPSQWSQHENEGGRPDNAGEVYFSIKHREFFYVSLPLLNALTMVML